MQKRSHLYRVTDEEITVWNIFCADNKLHHFVQTYKNSNNTDTFNVSVRDLKEINYYTVPLFQYKTLETYVGLQKKLDILSGFETLSNYDSKRTIHLYNYASPFIKCKNDYKVSYKKIDYLLRLCAYTDC